MIEAICAIYAGFGAGLGWEIAFRTGYNDEAAGRCSLADPRWWAGFFVVVALWPWFWRETR